jgi:hypothetical protein
MFCDAFFRECKEVDDGDGQMVWMPALLCRGECERRVAVWDECVAGVTTDVELQNKFDTQMLELTSKMAAASGNFLDKSFHQVGKCVCCKMYLTWIAPVFHLFVFVCEPIRHAFIRWEFNPLGHYYFKMSLWYPL